MMITSKIAKAIRNPYLIFAYLNTKGLFKWVPDRLIISWIYRRKLGKKLNISSPKTFNEKIQWLKLNNRRDEFTQMVDKYEVKKYIKEKIGDEYLIPTLGVWDRFDDIDFESLPNQFVLKCTHDSGGLVICKDKNELDIAMIKRKIEKSLKRNYYYHGREWPYKNVKPRIICEKYMEDTSSSELMDYKFMCFNGEVKCTFVCSNRKSKGLNIDIFDSDWNLMPFQRPLHPNSGTKLNPPENYKKMIELAEKLSKDIPFLRVDFYEINGCLYFGELTFYPGSGFEEFTPESYDELLGSWVRLPEKQT